MYIVLRIGLRGGLRFGGWRAVRVMKIADPRITSELTAVVRAAKTSRDEKCKR